MSFRPKTTPLHPQCLLASKTTQSALLGGNSHHPASLVLGGTNPGPTALPTWPNATPQPNVAFPGPRVLETARSVLMGGNYHHPATLGPTRTCPELSALAKRPNEVTTTSKHNENKWVDEEKHQLRGRNGRNWRIRETRMETAVSGLTTTFLMPQLPRASHHLF